MPSRFTTVLAGAAVIAAVSGSSAFAASQITSRDIKNDTILSRDIHNGGVGYRDLSAYTHKKIDSKANIGLDGAIYRVENYKNGGGGSATVACADDDAKSQQYTAIAGGVQGSESGKTEDPTGFAVSSSFPGRMDWNTGTPKPNRLDGWIIFGNGQHTDTLKVWALCVPTTSIPVQTVDLDN